MASGATTSLHTSYLPTRAGNFPKATDLSGPAVNIIVLRLPAAGSDSRTNISRAILVLAEQPPFHRAEGAAVALFGHGDLADVRARCGFERPGRFGQGARIDAEAIEFGAREDMQALEFHRLDQIVQLAADAHGNDEGGALVVGPRHAALLELGNLLRRERPVGEQRQFGVMHGNHGIGRDLAGGGAEKQIAASGVAHGVAGRELGLDLPACRLDLEAGRVDLGSSGATGCDGASDPGDGLPAAQQAGDDIRRPDRAARRMKIDRPLAVLDVAQEAADAGGRALIDLAFDRDPAIAT